MKDEALGVIPLLSVASRAGASVGTPWDWSYPGTALARKSVTWLTEGVYGITIEMAAALTAHMNIKDSPITG